MLHLLHLIEQNEEEIVDFSKRLDKTNNLVKDVYEQLDDIKTMYDLNDEDIEIIHEVNNKFKTLTLSKILLIFLRDSVIL